VNDKPLGKPLKDFDATYSGEALILDAFFNQTRERDVSELKKAAKRMIDLLTVDGDQPSITIPPDVDTQEFTEAFDNLARALHPPNSSDTQEAA
jgi:hypothetical protein